MRFLAIFLIAVLVAATVALPVDETDIDNG